MYSSAEPSQEEIEVRRSSAGDTSGSAAVLAVSGSAYFTFMFSVTTEYLPCEDPAAASNPQERHGFRDAGGLVRALQLDPVQDLQLPTVRRPGNRGQRQPVPDAGTDP